MINATVLICLIDAVLRRIVDIIQNCVTTAPTASTSATVVLNDLTITLLEESLPQLRKLKLL